MARRTIILITLVALALAGTSAHAYDFWGVRMYTTPRPGTPGTQLAFNGLSGTNIQYVVGSYKYTWVDSGWSTSHQAASPGAGYWASWEVDAQGLFFKPDPDFLKIMVIAGTPQGGFTAPECGYDTRQFGPGDLKIDAGGHTYGVGLRISNLTWFDGPDPKFKIYKANGLVDNDIHARDAGTLGRVEMDPLRWDHVDNSSLGACNAASAFFVKGSGDLVGDAIVTYQGNTGVSIDTGHTGWPTMNVYAYEISVPWATLGMNPNNYHFTASWRPDCGNDIISGCFVGGETYVPEPGSIIAILTGLIGIIGHRRRK